MGYFWRGLFRDSRFFWVSRIIVGIWFVASIDFITSTLKPPGLFNYRWFYITLGGTILGIISYGIFLGCTQRQKRQKEMEAELQADVLEPRLEQEIRRMAAETPGFATHCFECIHFNHQLRQCSRLMNDQRIKDIRINNIKYCLYWQEAPAQKPH